MTVTITWEGALLTVIAVLAAVLLIYLIALVRKVLKTLDKTCAVLDDAKTVSGVAASQDQKVDKLVDGAYESVGTVVDAIKGNQSVVAAATHIVNAVTSFAGLVRKPTNKDKEHK